MPYRYFIFSFLITCSAFSNETVKDPQLKQDIETYSKRVGYEIAEDLASSPDIHDLEAVIVGIQQYLKPRNGS